MAARTRRNDDDGGYINIDVNNISDDKDHDADLNSDATTVLLNGSERSEGDSNDAGLREAAATSVSFKMEHVFKASQVSCPESFSVIPLLTESEGCPVCFMSVSECRDEGKDLLVLANCRHFVCIDCHNSLLNVTKFLEEEDFDRIFHTLSSM